jgi:hypothetical protein
MSNETSVHTDHAGVLAGFTANASDPAILRARIREVFADAEAAAPNEASAAIEALACCLEVVTPDSPASLAAVSPAITKFLVAWEKMAEAAPSVADTEIPKKILARVPASVREDKGFPALIKKAEKALGRAPSKMTIAAVASNIDPDAVPRIVKSEQNAEVLEALVASHGDLIDARTATQVFKRLNDAGMSAELSQAFTRLKHRTIGELLPLDDRGTLGQTLSRGALAAIVKPLPTKAVVSILRNCGSRRVIECCVAERVLAADTGREDVAKLLRAFFEGLAKFATSDSEAMCSRLVTSSVSSGTIVDALLGSAEQSPWHEHGRNALVNAALRTLTVPELRKRALSLLIRADELAWLDGDAAQRYEEALAIQQAKVPEEGDDGALRWRMCDRVIACLERARDQNYDRVALEALLMGTLGEFGLRTGANAGDHSSFDGDIHEITLWSCRQGEAILLQTDVLRLDDPVQGDVIRKGKVIPVAKVRETATALPTQ